MQTLKQAIKHIITGGIADVGDLVFFEIIFFISGQDILSKAISYIGAILIKYYGNKYWVFNKPEKDDFKKEAVQFAIVTLTGFLINIAVFHFFVNIKTGIKMDLWRPACVIIAMGATALWNFPAYKFLVFKKQNV